jgi:hypothetical protein
LIETGLLQIQSEVLREQQTRPTQPPSQEGVLMAASRIDLFATAVRSQHACSGNENDRDSINSETTADTRTKPASRMPDPRLDLAQSSCASPISTVACSNGLAAMRWHSGARSGRRCLR